MHLLVLFVICLALRISASKKTFKNQIFIIPILWHGPNNQITEIKEAISLSHLLPGSKAVVPNLQEHKFSDGGVNRMISSELFDFNILRSGKVPIVLLEDLRKTWNGSLDVILYFRDEDFPPVGMLVKDMGLKAPAMMKRLRSPISVTRGCRRDQIQRLQAMLWPHRYVGVLSYDSFAHKTHKLAGTLLSNCGADLCCQAFSECSVLLRTSPQVCALAESYIRTQMGENKTFIAGHIRPMPDDCIKLWQSPLEELDAVEMSNVCRNDFIHGRFVADFQALMREYKTETVFVMAHPIIRPRVERMLKAGGIEPLILNMSYLEASIAAAAQPLETPLSFSLLAMVEEAVAAAAAAFVGTAESSMTGMIVQERIARGLAPGSNYFFSERRGCSKLPCSVPDYYVRRDSRISKGRPASIAAISNSVAVNS